MTTIHDKIRDAVHKHVMMDPRMGRYFYFDHADYFTKVERHVATLLRDKVSRQCIFISHPLKTLLRP